MESPAQYETPIGPSRFVVYPPSAVTETLQLLDMASSDPQPVSLKQLIQDRQLSSADGAEIERELSNPDMLMLLVNSYRLLDAVREDLAPDDTWHNVPQPANLIRAGDKEGIVAYIEYIEGKLPKHGMPCNLTVLFRGSNYPETVSCVAYHGGGVFLDNDKKPDSYVVIDEQQVPCKFRFLRKEDFK